MRNTKISISTTSSSAEKLSSGLRINKAGDDAAGLSISEKMRAQIRGLNQASRNSQDAISFIQTAEGALDEVHSLIQRARELCVQAANSTYNYADRLTTQVEIDEITKEINRIGDSTEFNNIRCFPPNGSTANSLFNNYIELSYDYVTSSVSAIGAVTNYTGSNQIIADTITGSIAPNAVKQILDTFAAFTDSKDAGVKIGLDLGGVNDGPYNVLASAMVIAGYNNLGGGGTMAYTLNYDLADISAADIATNGDYRQTTAHELMHVLMFENLTNGMISSDSFPDWFVEGSAQAAGGGVDRIRTSILSAPTDANISTYLSSFKTNVYAQGYIATMYLGYLAGGSVMTSSGIASGLDKIYTDIHNGATLSESIANNTTYTSLSDFENRFSTDGVTFSKDLVAASGSDGVGSVIASGLSDTGMTMIGNGSVTVNSFILDSTNSMFENVYDSSVTILKGGGATGIPTSSDGSSFVNLPSINIQVGANSKNFIQIDLYNISTTNLGINSTDVSSITSASNALETYDKAISKISYIRGTYGAIQNRLEHTIRNVDNSAENLQNAESVVRDVDMAKEMMKYSKDNILLKVGQSLLSQINQDSRAILSLLQ